MTAPAATPRAQRVRTPGAFTALYRLILRNQATVPRIIAVCGLGGLGLFLGLAVRLNDPFDAVDAGTKLVNGYGLTIVVPVVTLMFASSALGDLVDDKTLVYLWLRPVSRLTVVAAAAAATLTICLPAVVLPLAVSAALTGGGAAVVGGITVAAAVGVVAYTGMFGALGLRFRRALVWGLAYILLWEGFVATASKTASRLAIRSYTRSVLSEYTGVGLRQADIALGLAIVVPMLVGVAFTLLTAPMLAKATVD